MTGEIREREVKPQLPTSGQILGALVAKLGVKHSTLQSRTARRFFAGDTDHLVKDTTRMEIIEAIAEVLNEYGLIPSVDDDRPGSALAATLDWHAEHWDLLRSHLGQRMMAVLPSHLPMVWESYLRLAVIDLAIRLAAHLHLAGSSPAALTLLGFTDRRGRGNYLNQKREESGLSLDEFSERVGVSVNAVDGWMYSGARPLNDNLVSIADVLADSAGADSAGLERELRALYWISDVAELLVEHIGEEAVVEAMSRLRRYAGLAFDVIADRVRVEGRAEMLRALADRGVSARDAGPLLAALRAQESDAEWREDLRCRGGMSWIRRVLSGNLQVHMDEVDDAIARTDGGLLKQWDVSNPEAYAHYRRSHELQVQGDMAGAMAEVELAARLDPLDPVNHFTIGSARTHFGFINGDAVMFQEGVDALWLAATLDPHWILPWTEIGMTLLMRGEPEAALLHLRNLSAECEEPDANYHRSVGAVLSNLNRLPEALAAYEAALELDPEARSTLLAASELAALVGDRVKQRRYNQLAHHFGLTRDADEVLAFLRSFRTDESRDDPEHDRAIAVWSGAIRLDPDDGYAYLRRGVAQFAKKQDDLAIADLDVAVRLLPDDADVFMVRGTVQGYRGQWEGLVADMTEVIRRRPEDARAYLMRGQARCEREEFDQAYGDLCEAIRLEPGCGEAHRSRGRCLRDLGEHDRAIADFETALLLDPDDAAAYLGRGATYRMNRQLDEAIADYDVCLRLAPDDAFAYRLRADALVAQGDYERAVEDATRSLRLNPGDAQAHLVRGNANLFIGRFEAAFADFNSAVEIDPSDGHLWCGRGVARGCLEDEEGAAADFERARQLGYDVDFLDGDGQDDGE